MAIYIFFHEQTTKNSYFLPSNQIFSLYNKNRTKTEVDIEVKPKKGTKATLIVSVTRVFLILFT